MTDETRMSEALDPLAKAVAHGYVEPPAITREQRVKTLIADIDHAMKSNAPISPATFSELTALLGG